MTPHQAPAKVASTIDKLVNEMTAETGISEPPVDAIRIAKSLGMEIAWDTTLTGRARMVQLRQHHGPAAASAIFLRPEPRGERRQWAVAHEIGESIAHRLFADMGTSADDAGEGSREQVANLFATRLLVPSTWFKEMASSCNWDITELKTPFSTASHEIIARRMLDFEPRVVITILDQGKLTFRGGNMGGAAPPLQELECACQQTVQETGQPCFLSCEEFSVQGWPIYEGDWRREILRLEARDSWD